MKNEKRLVEFLVESIKEEDLLSTVILYGDFEKGYEASKEIFRSIENGEIKNKELGKSEIKTMECLSRFMLLCEVMDGIGNYEQLKEEVIRYKKRAFYNLNVGDSVTIRTKRVRKRFRYGTPSVSENEIKTEVIKLDAKGSKVQVKYGNRWFCPSDYPEIINTVDRGRLFGGCEEIYNIEHGKDTLFEILK